VNTNGRFYGEETCNALLHMDKTKCYFFNISDFGDVEDELYRISATHSCGYGESYLLEYITV
jgi:hypothetical protein